LSFGAKEKFVAAVEILDKYTTCGIVWGKAFRAQEHRGTKVITIPMTPSSSAGGYREHEGVAGEESSYWPSASPGAHISTSGDEGTGAKVRKPYTITKQRERWTEEEHQKFLEALKLYGRAWRRIEEHIGTKTAVQIRSHAQKFFSKVEREATAGAGVETGVVSPVIDIPPPRPKRKPTHPYPRKAGRSFGKSSEDDCPLATVGSMSCSSGISTANIAEACVKNGAREQVEHAVEIVEDGPKAQTDDSKEVDREGFARQWPSAKAAASANVVQFPVGAAHPLAAGLNAGVHAQNGSAPVPFSIPAFHPAQWGRMLHGGFTPGMMPPQGMVMPWVGAPNGHAHEDGGVAAAMAATIAAASAWWAMQGSIPPGVMHPAMGAFFPGASPPLAIPSPYLFPQAAPQEVTVAAAPSGLEGKESMSTQGAQDYHQEVAGNNSSGSLVRSSAVRRAERALRVKELKARRLGSGNLSVSSDICGSSWGSGLNRSNSTGHVTVANLTVEGASDPLLKGMSLPLKLNKAKHTLCGHVRKEKEPLVAGGSDDEGDDKRKRLKTGRALGGNGESGVPLGVSNEAPVELGHLEKVRSVSGSNSLSGKFSKEDVAMAFADEIPPREASCGSDVSEDVAEKVDGNASGEGGPSSNSSACGNVQGDGNRAGSSDGSSEEEERKGGSNAAAKDQAMANGGRSSPESEEAVGVEGKDSRFPRRFAYSEFLPISKEAQKHEKQESASRAPRQLSADEEKRKEVTERGQIAFQALFKRDTLPRTFSPPPRLSLSMEEPAEKCKPSAKEGSANQSPSLGHMKRSMNNAATSSDRMDRQSPDQDSAFNTWQPSNTDCCDGSMATTSSRSLDRRGSSKCRDQPRMVSVNWLQLRTDTSSLDKDDDDEDAESGAEDNCDMQQEENIVCKLDLSEKTLRGKLDSEVDGLGTTRLDRGPKIRCRTLSLSIATGSGTALSTVSSTGSVKYSGLGFVPYQRTTLSVEPSLKL